MLPVFGVRVSVTFNLRLRHPLKGHESSGCGVEQIEREQPSASRVKPSVYTVKNIYMAMFEYTLLRP